MSAMCAEPAHLTVLQAVEQDDLDAVEAALANGGQTDSRAASGLTPLMIAAGRGNARMVELLLDHGADALCVDAGAGVSVLHKACQGGNVDVVRLLVEKGGAFVDLPAATTGHTALMDALWFKWPDVVAYLLEKGAGLNLSTHYGFTLQQHIDYERSVNFLDRERFAAAERLVAVRRRQNDAAVKAQVLMAAVVKGDVQEVQALLQSGAASVNERFPGMNGFNDDHTPLHVAAREGRTEIVELLLKAGAEVNAVEPVFGAVPLHKAVYNGHARVTQLLADHPDVDLDFQGLTNGYTPLHDALWHGFADCALILIAKGARLDLRGHDGKLPVDLARDVFTQSGEVLSALGA